MIYDYKVTTGTGEELNLADYKGKVILVVNRGFVIRNIRSIGK